MVERSLSMREVRGSIPRFSRFCIGFVVLHGSGTRADQFSYYGRQITAMRWSGETVRFSDFMFEILETHPSED